MVIVLKAGCQALRTVGTSGKIKTVGKARITWVPAKTAGTLRRSPASMSCSAPEPRQDHPLGNATIIGRVEQGELSARTKLLCRASGRQTVEGRSAQAEHSARQIPGITMPRGNST